MPPEESIWLPPELTTVPMAEPPPKMVWPPPELTMVETALPIL
jgi:hypothetical protein